MMRPATIFLGIWRRGDGLARAEEGSGEESVRASAFFFEKIGGYKLRKEKIHVSIVVRVKFNTHTYTIILWKVKINKLGIKLKLSAPSKD